MTVSLKEIAVDDLQLGNKYTELEQKPDFFAISNMIFRKSLVMSEHYFVCLAKRNCVLKYRPLEDDKIHILEE